MIFKLHANPWSSELTVRYFMRVIIYGQRENFYNYNHWQNLKQTLDSMWNSTLRENFNFYFWVIFCDYWQNLPFWRRTTILEEDRALGYNFMRSSSFPRVSKFPKILHPNFLSLKLFGNSWDISCIPLFLLINILLSLVAKKKKNC